MHYEIIMTVFTSVFLAELGDKTQIATFLFASDKNFSKMDVFAGACLALILSSAIGVFAGSIISRSIDPKYISYTSGILFIVIGCVVLYKA